MFVYIWLLFWQLPTNYIPIKNPSLEGIPFTGDPNYMADDWHICALTPDIFDTIFWFLGPSHGETFVGIIDWDAIGQRLECPMLPNKKHFFYVDICDLAPALNYIEAVYEVWAGTDSCLHDQLLHTAQTHGDELPWFWYRDTISFVPKQTYTHLRIEVIPDSIINQANGLLLDNLSPIYIEDANSKISQKSFYITSTNNGNYDITLIYKASEISALGGTASSYKMIKTPNKIQNTTTSVGAQYPAQYPNTVV